VFAESRGAYPAPAPPFDAVLALSKLVGGFKPDGRRNKILLVAPSYDAATARLALALIERGAAVRTFDVETLNLTAALSFELDDRGRPRGVLTLPSGVVALDEVRAVWVRQSLTGAAPEGSEGADDRFARLESGEALAGLPAMIDGASWIGWPAVPASALSKTAVLRAAAAVGLRIPRTLVTNEEARARKFVGEREGGSIVKAFTWLVGDTPEAARLVFTHRIRPEHHAELHRVRYAPCLFQEEVPRAVELRVTVVGRRSFTAEISAARPAEAVDWRDPRAGVSLRPAALPAEIERSCLAILDRFGLAYAAIDLIRRPDGEHVFLDLNPHGNWLHAEDAAGLPITAAIADLLEGGAVTGSSADPG
jgi:hypothetical protein